MHKQIIINLNHKIEVKYHKLKINKTLNYLKLLKKDMKIKLKYKQTII